MKSIQTVLIEAIVVGICLIAIVKFYSMDSITKFIPNTGFGKDVEILFISGVAFHLIFEYTGVNKWYAIEYCKLV